jgi:hypothetical protein
LRRQFWPGKDEKTMLTGRHPSTLPFLFTHHPRKKLSSMRRLVT